MENANNQVPDENKKQHNSKNKCCTNHCGNLCFPIILIVIGTALLLKNTGIITIPQIDFRTYWPLILIIIGALLLFNRLKK